MVSNRNHPNMTDGFISTQVVGRGLDERTAKAYRMDLEKFYLWLESDRDKVRTGKEDDESGSSGKVQKSEGDSVPDEMEAYLDYLSKEKGLRYSTICRKKRVFGSYLSYLASQGMLKTYAPLKIESQPEKTVADTLLTKREVDRLFQAIDREYENLDSEFRRRVCLRDQVMMKLLFYHGIDVSELLKLEVTDYDRREAVLTIRGKKGKIKDVKVFSQTLKRQLGEWLNEHEYFERDGEYGKRMFLSKMGRPLSMKMVINIFDKYREMAGIEKDCKPKDLKNSLGRYAREMVVEMGE